MVHGEPGGSDQRDSCWSWSTLTESVMLIYITFSRLYRYILRYVHMLCYTRATWSSSWRCRRLALFRRCLIKYHRSMR